MTRCLVVPVSVCKVVPHVLRFPPAVDCSKYFHTALLILFVGLSADNSMNYTVHEAGTAMQKSAFQISAPEVRTKATTLRRNVERTEALLFRGLDDVSRASCHFSARYGWHNTTIRRTAVLQTKLMNTFQFHAFG